MNIHDKKISYYQIIVGGIFVFVSGFFILYINSEDSKTQSILSGLITGGVILLCQALMDGYEFKTVDKYRRLGVTDILGNKKKREFYGKLILHTNKDIKMLGITAADLLNDFGNENSDDEISKALITAIQKKCQIQFLLADEVFLDEAHKAKAGTAKSKLAVLSKNNNFSVRYYKHTPAHSIVIVDDTCIVGPIFTGKSNRETPAIHLERHSQLAKHYEDYFDSEWNVCDK
ncbi:hypothetical protein [Methylomonas sp. MgM2]